MNNKRKKKIKKTLDKINENHQESLRELANDSRENDRERVKWILEESVNLDRKEDIADEICEYFEEAKDKQIASLKEEIERYKLTVSAYEISDNKQAKVIAELRDEIKRLKSRM